MQTKCGHRCCKTCLDEHFKRLDQNMQPWNCPVDRNWLQQNEIFADKATERKILSFEIRCSSEGCRWTGELRSKDVIT
ncbi:unnamed protein product [Porites evermanni]|uniref:Zinc finger C3HC4 RING-type domain-containing protein n=1 Tax=Porites evermanni TaxID=104178 RepID=A0ABN8RUX6_9CNID|nr:unnamed protein product [Porites evermanni]